MVFETEARRDTVKNLLKPMFFNEIRCKKPLFGLKDFEGEHDLMTIIGIKNVFPLDMQQQLSSYLKEILTDEEMRINGGFSSFIQTFGFVHRGMTIEESIRTTMSEDLPDVVLQSMFSGTITHTFKFREEPPAKRVKQPDAPITAMIESPFTGTIIHSTDENLKYLRKCLTALYKNKRAPIGLHDVYPRLPDGKLHEDSETVPGMPGRDYALACNREFRKRVEEVYFFIDHGWTEGMAQAMYECVEDDIQTIIIAWLDYEPCRDPLSASFKDLPEEFKKRVTIKKFINE